MKKGFALLFAASSVTMLSAAELITVYKDGYDFFVRSSYSQTQDLVIRNWRYANEEAFIVSKKLPIQDVLKQKRLHTNIDEYPATPPFGYFGTMGGNHGSPFARMLQIPAHGMTVQDIGGVIKDKSGTVYIILQIVDNDRILIHPEGENDTFNPGFRRHTSAKLFYKGKELPFKKSESSQLYPLNRITDCRLLADGKTPVADKTETKCRFVDFIFTHDVINPYAAVQSVKNHPGQKPAPELTNQWGRMTYLHTPELQKRYPEYMKLPMLATYYNVFRFEAHGACVNYRKTVYHAALSYVHVLDVMFGWGGDIANQPRDEFYIPKLKPISVKAYPAGKDQICDFSEVYRMPNPMSVNTFIMRKDCLDPMDPPDRFIRLSGNTQRQYGIVLGYSLFLGGSAKSGGNPDRDRIYHLWRTKKMYPYVHTLKNIQPGKVTETVSYRQYFNPQLEPDATSFYFHHQGSSLVVYLDFHKQLKNKLIRLPEEASGKKINVLEKTSGLRLHESGTVPTEGIHLDQTSKRGYLVLKLD